LAVERKALRFKKVFRDWLRGTRLDEKKKKAPKTEGNGKNLAKTATDGSMKERGKGPMESVVKWGPLGTRKVRD